MVTLDSAKAWFAQNRELILESYGQRHRLQKEDILLGELSLEGLRRPCIKFSIHRSYWDAGHSGLWTL